MFVPDPNFLFCLCFWCPVWAASYSRLCLTWPGYPTHLQHFVHDYVIESISANTLLTHPLLIERTPRYIHIGRRNAYISYVHTCCSCLRCKRKEAICTYDANLVGCIRGHTSEHGDDAQRGHDSIPREAISAMASLANPLSCCACLILHWFVCM